MKRWVEMLQIIKIVEHITFRFCIKPEAAVVGSPILVMCNDASTLAMCATAHVRWKLDHGGYDCSSKERDYTSLRNAIFCTFNETQEINYNSLKVTV